MTPSLNAANPIPNDFKIAGFALGCQAYTFNRFTVFEAIEKTDQAGGRIIEFFPGQRLSKEEPTIKWDHNSPAEVVAKVKAKLDQHRIKAVNYGVVGISKDEAEARKVFEFAKTMGLYAVTTESLDALDTIEKLVREYDIKVAYHEHAKNPGNPNYKIWDPVYLAGMLKGRDMRIGACADTGHWASSGLQPVKCLRILKGRIISTHLKERATIGSHLPDQVFGTGVSDISQCLQELKRQGFEGNISLEYENNWDHSVPDVAQCIGFVRGWGSSRK
ncbi:MAG: sugar phosphate isomerase/epimerase [Verrucomicrobia bacterium]|nr:sugar phosphate isomerase/epimerase [Verrucomicrobiota bacterium]MBI3867654.1 sugar phosphate isomerase/epimerase [Verrucomicrobiota bacterium]